MKHQEHIVAVRADALAGFQEGVTRMGLAEFSANFSKDVVIAQRAWLETNEDFRQVIPYFLLIDRNKGNVIVPYRRVSGGENRLLDKVSVGFGGHVDAIDIRGNEKGVISLIETVIAAAYREFSEEVDLHGKEEEIGGLFDIGVLIDNSNEVGRVHVGLVLAVSIDTDWPFNAKEDGIEMMEPATSGDILQAGYDLENWTRIVLSHLVQPVLNEEKPAAEAGIAELAE